MGISDLMYMEEREYLEQMKAELSAHFPQVVFDDASDYIHRNRIGVNVDDIEETDWYLWLLRSGWWEFSFNFELDKGLAPEKVKPLMQQVIDERTKQSNSGIPF